MRKSILSIILAFAFVCTSTTMPAYAMETIEDYNHAHEHTAYKIGDIIEADSIALTVYHVDEVGTAYAVPANEYRRMIMVRTACQHPSNMLSLNSTGTDYNHINSSTECYKTRTYSVHTCRACGFGAVYTYGKWSSAYSHKYNILGSCSNKLNSTGSITCGRKK